MNLIKFFVVVLFLIFSSQSSALFMPADYQVNPDTKVASNNVGCWVFFYRMKRKYWDRQHLHIILKKSVESTGVLLLGNSSSAIAPALP